MVWKSGRQPGQLIDARSRAGGRSHPTRCEGRIRRGLAREVFPSRTPSARARATASSLRRRRIRLTCPDGIIGRYNVVLDNLSTHDTAEVQA
jgi:hypothetical protein